MRVAVMELDLGGLPKVEWTAVAEELSLEYYSAMRKQELVAKSSTCGAGQDEISKVGGEVRKECQEREWDEQLKRQEGGWEEQLKQRQLERPKFSVEDC